MSDQPQTDPSRRRGEPIPPDETVVQHRVERREVVVPPGDPDVAPGVVHEQERVGIGRDGAVVREFDRIEQPPVDRRGNRWPWIISALLVLILAALAIWYFTRDSQATVTPVTGQPVTTAVARLQSDGFETRVIRRVSSRRPGTVVGEEPAGGTSADEGSLVVLTVAAASTSVAVPNAVGVPQADARDRLVAAGFRVKSVSVSSDQPVGTVVAQDPAAGEKILRGTSVRINVSKGSATANVPSEVGKTAEEAQSDLADKGFEPSVVKVPSDEPAGTVVAQDPAGGQARKGATVQLSVSEGPAATTEPTTTATTETTVTVPATTAAGTTTTSP